MPFQVVEIVEALSENVRAVVRHGEHRIPVIVAGKNVQDLAVGQTLRAEIRFDRILAWKTIDDFEDASSRIWQAEDGIHLLGRVHSVLDYGDGKTVIDVYMQTGPEFFRVDAETIGTDELEPNSGLEIIVSNLYIYPIDH
jgi:hypothetical protein